MSTDLPPLRRQLARFVAVGVVSAVVDFSILIAGQELAYLRYDVAKAISFVAGTLTAYSLNRLWTFKAEHSRRRLLGVALLYGLTFALQVGTFALLYPGLLGWGKTVANVVGFVVAQGLATTLNFVVQRAVIFRPRA